MAQQPFSFLGDWLVSEYVYTPAGEYAGVIHQRRKLQPQGDVIRVIQICEPVKVAEGISEQAKSVVEIMNKRVGEFVFDLKVVGKARHYLGEDVVGGGFSWRDGVLTARGMWTRFGYNFTSFSMLLNPNRQVTGGKFFVANEEVATIVGVGVPEDEGYPVLQAVSPSGKYHGERYLISPDGELLETIDITADDVTFNETEGMRGRQKQYGALREIEAVTAPGETVSWMELNDETTGMVAGLCKWNRDEKLHHVLVYFLTADGRPPSVIHGQPSAVGGQR